MPLVVPGVNNTDGGDLTYQWLSKLAGKKIGETHDEVTFAKKDLPSEHRIMKKGDFATTDFKPDRLNIYTADDGTVTEVKHG